MGPYDGYEFRPNEALREAGLVTTTRDGDEVPSWFQLKDEELVDGDDGDDGHPVLTRAAALAARFGLTYQRGKAILDRLGLAEVVGRHVPVAAVFAASERVDHANSRAYLRSPSELGLRLNVAGREPAGTVPADEYEEAREDLIERLRAVETPDGDPVFDSVVPREAHVHGPYADEAVDVFCVPAGFEHSLSSLVGEQWADPEPYNHKLTGVVAVAGDATADVTGAHLFDVAPTVLATMGVAPDESMDGAALVDGPAPTAYPEFDPGERGGTDDAAVEERLADLGYLE
jgi:predicted AlkP superfamily phosphohydrolase/phosphomutase